MARVLTSLICLSVTCLGALSANAATSSDLDRARDQGLAWLLVHQSGDGSWRSTAGTEFVATASAVEALGMAGLKSRPYAAAMAWLANAPVLSVDSLARKVATLSSGGLNIATAAAMLVSSRNAAAAWGAYAGFDTGFPDTPLALAALRLAQYPYPSTDRTLGLCAVLRAQSLVDGSWSFVTRSAAGMAPGNASKGAMVPTVAAALEVNASGASVACTNPSQTYTTATVIGNAKAWLLSQRRGDGGFGVDGTSTILETILAYQALSVLAPGAPETVGALDYIVSRQASDGSWGGDALETALALKTIPIGTPYAVDTDVDTIPDRVEIALGTSPVSPDSRLIPRGNGLTSMPEAGLTNDFGLSLALPGPDTRSPEVTATLPQFFASSIKIDAQTLARTRPDPLAVTVSLDRFQVDTLRGSAIGEIPIVLPPGPGGITPKLVLRYDSATADALTVGEPAQNTGLGWTLDVGAVIVRDNKGTSSLADDTFRLLLDGKSYDLKADGAGVYHTTDETFIRIQYLGAQDYWILTMKDGTQHRLGFAANSRWQTLTSSLASPPNYDTPVTYRYLVDQIMAPTGVATTFGYAAETGVVGSRSYHTAVYVSSIAYASVAGTPVGSALRTVTLSRIPRTDWPAPLPYPTYYDKNGALDSIDVKIGGARVRTYKFDYDYTSIDRAPGATWHGTGATGDLALRTLKIYGNDGSTAAMSTATFGYSPNPGRLVAVNNGLGGTVSFQYVRWLTPIFSVCVNQGCTDSGVCSDPDPWQNALLGQLLNDATSAPSTVPIYSTCARMGNTTCIDYSVGTKGPGTLLGYAVAPTSNPLPANLTPLYVNCSGGCKASTATGTLLGYIYPPTIPDRYAVTARTVNDGRIGDVQTTYAYGGLAVSPTGDVRGYGTAVVQEAASGSYPQTTTTWTYHTDSMKPGRLATVAVVAGGVTRKTITNSWTGSEVVPGTGIYFARLDQSSISVNDGAPFNDTQSFTYDAWGNVTSVLSAATGTGETRLEQTDWSSDTTNWIFKPQHVQLSGSSSGLVRQRWMTYSPQGLLRREESRVTGPAGTVGNIVWAYDYDPYGNQRTVTDPNGCTTTTTFDATQAFPASRATCVVGHVTTFTHDPGFGVPMTVTAPTGVTMTLSYDTFGRLLKITGPLASATYGWTSYAYAPLGDASLQTVRRYDGTGSWTDDYFDARGRVHTRQRRGPAGLAITSRRIFDVRGQVGQESLPSLPGEALAWTTYSYDVLGRRTAMRYPDLTTVAFAYGAGGVTTVTDERGNATLITRDGWGRVRRVLEPTGGQTDYAYDVADNLLSATDPSGGPATTMTYDRVGRRLTLSDPMAGAWTFAYDTRGNVVDRTDGNGATVHFTYDAYNRVTSKTYPDGTGAVSWTYDDPNVTFSKGRLTRVQDGVTTTTFAYDAAGRVTQLSRVLDGSAYALGLTYDAASRVATRTFPDGETVTYTTNEAGWLAGMTGSWPGGSRPYVASVSYNGRGQRTAVRYGNGVVSTLTYDPTTSRLTGMLTVGPSGALQNLAYAYDPAGNLVRVDDGVGSAGRRYTYDAGNRLIGASGWFNGIAEQYTYSVAGNLTSRASLLYTYSDASHPWRVGMTTDGRAYSYDGNGSATRAAGLQLTWDLDQRVHTITGPGGALTLDYDSAGHRVRRTANVDVTLSPFPGYEIDARGVVTKWLGDVARRGVSVLTYHDDHLGSTHVISDGQGMPLQIREYSAWGVVVRSEGTADSRTRFATRAVTGARSTPYDASLGRFLGTDAAVPDAHDPGSRNRYAYGRNNPATLLEMVRPGSNEWP